MTGFPGGLTAWAPAVLTVLVCSWVAYRGQVRFSSRHVLSFGRLRLTLKHDLAFSKHAAVVMMVVERFCLLVASCL